MNISYSSEQDIFMKKHAFSMIGAIVKISAIFRKQLILAFHLENSKRHIPDS